MHFHPHQQDGHQSKRAGYDPNNAFSGSSLGIISKADGSCATAQCGQCIRWAIMGRARALVYHRALAAYRSTSRAMRIDAIVAIAAEFEQSAGTSHVARR